MYPHTSLDSMTAKHHCLHCRAAEGVSLKRCSRCKAAWFCSQMCQRKAWKVHKRFCCPVETQEAWRELQSHVRNMPIEEAHQRFQMATVEMEHLQKQSTEDVTRSNRAKATKLSPLLPAVSTDSNPYPKSPRIMTKVKKSFPITQHRDFRYVVEETPNISCYQVMLSVPSSTSVSVSVESLSHISSSLVNVSSNGGISLFTICFPVSLVQQALTQIQSLGDCWYFRLQSSSTLPPSEMTDPPNTTTPKVMDSMSCRSCRRNLFQTTIQRILPLPSGYWDEIADYLICYEGQASVDFSLSSTHAQQGTVMEDSTVVVVHKDDVGDSLCVLAIEGYGEVADVTSGSSAPLTEGDDVITFRGQRRWKDSVGGATVCCSQCCATLGFASLESPETLRLLKHRLLFSAGPQLPSPYCVASFVAHQLVRYAESKAIYTMTVVAESHETCLLLRLVSWETRLADSHESVYDESELDILHFRNVAKVIYEEKAIPIAITADPLQWNWSGIDFCCPIETKPNNDLSNSPPENSGLASSQNASVRIVLPMEEWNELNEALRSGSKLFLSSDVVTATIQLKLGENFSDRDLVGLSALSLS